MKAAIEEIHRDPAILDRAIERGVPVDITRDGEVCAVLNPIELRKKRRDRKIGPIPDFARRRAEWGMKPMSLEQREEFFRFLRGE